MQKDHSVTTTARKLKMTVVLDAAPFIRLGVPADSAPQRTAIEVAVGGRTLLADVATKSVRKLVKALQEHGPDGVTVVMQGVLAAGDRVVEAGLVAQIKTPPVDRPAG